MTAEIAEILSHFKKSRVSLYALPWILVVGSKSSGKTQLLTQAGLSFSKRILVSDQCEWFFSDKAVFIEVNLAITPQEINALLVFIKKYRPRCPLNSLIFVKRLTGESVDTTGDESVKLLREFFSLASDQLGFVLPVYLCVSHVDDIQGFESYFKGTTEPVFISQKDNYTVLFSSVYRLAQLHSHPAEKLACLSFPDNFRCAEHRLQSWTDELVRPTPYQETPELQTIYFIAPSIFVAGTLANIIALSLLQRKKQKSRKHQWLSRWKMSVSLVTASVMVLLVFVLCSVSYAHQRFTIQEGVQLGQMVAQTNNPDQNQALVRYLSDHPPVQLIPILQTILLNRLETDVMPSYFAQLENHLMLMQEKWALATTDQAEQMRGDYYNQLKTYLMFCYPQYRYSQFYQGHFLMAFYLNHSHRSWMARPDIVDLSRQQLAVSQALSNVTNVYAGLQSWGEKQLGVISARDLFGKSLESSVVISKFFTQRGFALYAMPEIDRLSHESAKGDWVMQSPPEMIKDNLLRLYKAAYKQAWIHFLEQLRSAVGETVTDKTVNKIMTTAHQNILFKAPDKADKKEQDRDPELYAAIKNILLLPQMTERMTEINSAWQSQVYDFYRQKLANHYPFSESASDVDSADFHTFFDMPQGIFWQFLQHYSKPSNNTLNFSSEFAKTVLQAKAFAAPLSFQLYPEPTPGLKEIRLVVNGQAYRYRNDPQEWQAMQWCVKDSHDESALEIITSSGAEGMIEFDSPWGFFRLLQKAELAKQGDEVFRATWRIRAEDGRIYEVSMLFKCAAPENLFEVVLFEKFMLSSQSNRGVFQ